MGVERDFARDAVKVGVILVVDVVGEGVQAGGFLEGGVQDLVVAGVGLGEVG